MADDFIRLSVAVVYTGSLYADMKRYEGLAAATHRDQVVYSDTVRDKMTKADVLLPLQRTKTEPMPQIDLEASHWMKQLLRQLTDGGTKVFPDHLEHILALTVLVLLALFLGPSVSAVVAHGQVKALVQTVALLSIVLGLCCQLLRRKKEHGYEITFSIFILLLSAEYIQDEVGSQSQHRGSRFSLFDLTAYLLLINPAFRAFFALKRFVWRERDLTSSQSVVNRLASTLFADSRSPTGYAILKIDQPGEVGEPEQDDQGDQAARAGDEPYLVRFNERFVKLIKPQVEGERPISDESLLRSMFNKSELSKLLLKNFFAPAAPGRHFEEESSFAEEGRRFSGNLQPRQELNFGEYLIHEIKKRRATPPQHPGSFQALENLRFFRDPSNEGGLADESPQKDLLFRTHFVCRPQQPHQAVAPDKNNGQPEGLEIEVRTLSSERQTYLVAINLITLARLYMPVQIEQALVNDIVPAQCSRLRDYPMVSPARFQARVQEHDALMKPGDESVLLRQPLGGVDRHISFEFGGALELPPHNGGSDDEYDDRQSIRSRDPQEQQDRRLAGSEQDDQEANREVSDQEVQEPSQAAPIDDQVAIVGVAAMSAIQNKTDTNESGAPNAAPSGSPPHSSASSSSSSVSAAHNSGNNSGDLSASEQAADIPSSSNDRTLCSNQSALSQIFQHERDSASLPDYHQQQSSSVPGDWANNSVPENQLLAESLPNRQGSATVEAPLQTSTITHESNWGESNESLKHQRDRDSRRKQPSIVFKPQTMKLAIHHIGGSQKGELGRQGKPIAAAQKDTGALSDSNSHQELFTGPILSKLVYKKRSSRSVGQLQDFGPRKVKKKQTEMLSDGNDISKLSISLLELGQPGLPELARFVSEGGENFALSEQAFVAEVIDKRPNDAEKSSREANDNSDLRISIAETTQKHFFGSKDSNEKNQQLNAKKSNEESQVSIGQNLELMRPMRLVSHDLCLWKRARPQTLKSPPNHKQQHRNKRRMSNGILSRSSHQSILFSEHSKRGGGGENSKHDTTRSNAHQIFVYKIIHDLRHPSFALQDGLTDLIERITKFKRNSREMFDTNTSQYLGKPIQQRAVTELEAYAEQLQLKVLRRATKRQSLYSQDGTQRKQSQPFRSESDKNIMSQMNDHSASSSPITISRESAMLQVQNPLANLPMSFSQARDSGSSSSQGSDSESSQPDVDDESMKQERKYLLLQHSQLMQEGSSNSQGVQELGAGSNESESLKNKNVSFLDQISRLSARRGENQGQVSVSVSSQASQQKKSIGQILQGGLKKSPKKPLEGQEVWESIHGYINNIDKKPAKSNENLDISDRHKDVMKVEARGNEEVRIEPKSAPQKSDSFDGQEPGKKINAALNPQKQSCNADKNINDSPEAKDPKKLQKDCPSDESSGEEYPIVATEGDVMQGANPQLQKQHKELTSSERVRAVALKPFLVPLLNSSRVKTLALEVLMHQSRSAHAAKDSWPVMPNKPEDKRSKIVGHKSILHLIASQREEAHKISRPSLSLKSASHEDEKSSDVVQIEEEKFGLDEPIQVDGVKSKSYNGSDESLGRSNSYGLDSSISSGAIQQNNASFSIQPEYEDPNALDGVVSNIGGVRKDDLVVDYDGAPCSSPLLRQGTERRISRVRLRDNIFVLLNERHHLCKLLKNWALANDTMLKKMKQMQGQLQMMTSLMRDLMNQAQLKNNTFTLVNEYFNCLSLVRSCLQTMRRQSSLKKIKLEGPVLEDPIHGLYFTQLWGDETRLSQIIMNFVSNAIKFTPADGTVSLRLHVSEVSGELRSQNGADSASDRRSNRSNLKHLNIKSLSVSQKSVSDATVSEESDAESAESIPDKSIGDDDSPPRIKKKEKVGAGELDAPVLPGPPELQLLSRSNSGSQQKKELVEKEVAFTMTFEDTGCGISKENQARLFGNFGKLEENADKNKQGVGLGLSICKEIILASGGKVEVISQQGVGTKFIIYLRAKCLVNQSLLQQAETMRREGLSLVNLLREVLDEEESDLDEEDAQDPFNSDNDKGSPFPSDGSRDQQVAMNGKASDSQSQLYRAGSFVSGMGSIRQQVARQSSMEQFSALSNVMERPEMEDCSDNSRSGGNNHSDYMSHSLSSQSQSKVSSSLKSASESKSMPSSSMSLSAQANNSRQQELDSANLVVNQQPDVQVEGLDSSSIVITRCLIANDNMFLLESFSAILTPHFTEVVQFENGQQAVDSVLSKPIDYFSVVILDIDMPLMDGKQACQLILKYFTDTELAQKQEPSAHSQPADSASPEDGEPDLGQQQPVANGEKGSIGPVVQIEEEKKEGEGVVQIEEEKKEGEGGEQVVGSKPGPRAAPMIYALTSDIDSKIVQSLTALGFCEVLSELSQITIQRILERAKIEYIAPKDDSNGNLYDMSAPYGLDFDSLIERQEQDIELDALREAEEGNDGPNSSRSSGSQQSSIDGAMSDFESERQDSARRGHCD